ncbi:nuclease PIN [Escherichia coli]|nr:nuclease PIN [Escherichia coli]
MNRTTTGLCLAALLVSCSMNSVLRADELVMRDNFFVADETRHQWVNEHNGRTGMLTVSGALLSSPCTLETNEVELPLHKLTEGLITRYAVKLNLLGCGDGGDVTSAPSVIGRGNMMVMQSAILYNRKEGGKAEQVLLSNGKVILDNGRNQLVFYMSKNQWQTKIKQNRSGYVHFAPIITSSLLNLRLSYE